MEKVIHYTFLGWNPFHDIRPFNIACSNSRGIECPSFMPEIN